MYRKSLNGLPGQLMNICQARGTSRCKIKSLNFMQLMLGQDRGKCEEVTVIRT